VRVQRRVLARVGENAASDCERVRSRSCARVGRCSRGAHNGICDSGQNDEQRGRYDARGKRDRARVRRVALRKRSQASGQTWPVPAQAWTRPGWRRCAMVQGSTHRCRVEVLVAPFPVSSALACEISRTRIRTRTSTRAQTYMHLHNRACSCRHICPRTHNTASSLTRTGTSTHRYTRADAHQYT
jgi:hypothetical protein